MSRSVPICCDCLGVVVVGAVVTVIAFPGPVTDSLSCCDVRQSREDSPIVKIQEERWKMNKHKYYDAPSPFPTLARGLFSIKEQGDESRYRIIARGYDKFFNIGEVPWTTVCIYLPHLFVSNLPFGASGHL